MSLRHHGKELEEDPRLFWLRNGNVLSEEQLMKERKGRR